MLSYVIGVWFSFLFNFLLESETVRETLKDGSVQDVECSISHPVQPVFSHVIAR